MKVIQTNLSYSNDQKIPVKILNRELKGCRKLIEKTEKLFIQQNTDVMHQTVLMTL